MILLSKLPYIEFYAALGIYIVFLFSAIVFRVASGSAPSGDVCKFHLRMAALYVVFVVFLSMFRGSLLLEDFANAIAGLLAYFFFHYAVVMNFIGLACRSVSATLIVDLKIRGGKMWESELFESYGEGKGFAFIKQNRLETMLLYGLATFQDGLWRPSPKGRRFAVLTGYVLNFLGLKQISEGSPQ